MYDKNFRSLNFEIKNELIGLWQKNPPCISDLGLGYLYIWSDYDHPRVTLINGNVCVLLTPYNLPPYFVDPIGNNLLKETVAACIAHTGRMLVSEKIIAELGSQNNYKVTEIPEQFDYVYETKILAELSGTKFASKRNNIHKFIREYPDFKFLPITRDFKDMAHAIVGKWDKDRKINSVYEIPTAMQIQALDKAFEYFCCCGFEGGFIEARGEPRGFILGSPLNQDTFIIHFQYGLDDAPGIYQILLQQFCAELQSRFTYVNLEQDIGIPGLRKMKMSYYPARIEKKFEITHA